MRYLKLLPHNHTPSPNLVWLHLEPAVFEIEHVGFLCKNSGKQSHYGPAKEPAVCCGVASVEERVFLLRVAVDVAVNPNLSLFSLRYSFHQIFNVKNLGVKLLVWINPLPI